MVKQVEAYAAADGSLFHKESDAKAKDLEQMVNPGAFQKLELLDAMRWVVTNFDQIKRVVES